MENNASSPFNAIRIVECGQGVSAAFGAKLLADLGANVIKVEPPQGDLTRRRGPFSAGRFEHPHPLRRRANPSLKGVGEGTRKKVVCSFTSTPTNEASSSTCNAPRGSSCLPIC